MAATCRGGVSDGHRADLAVLQHAEALDGQQRGGHRLQRVHQLLQRHAVARPHVLRRHRHVEVHRLLHAQHNQVLQRLRRWCYINQDSVGTTGAGYDRHDRTYILAGVELLRRARVHLHGHIHDRRLRAPRQHQSESDTVAITHHTQPEAARTSPGSSRPESVERAIHGLQTRCSSSLGTKCQYTIAAPTFLISNLDTCGCCGGMRGGGDGENDITK